MEEVPDIHKLTPLRLFSRVLHDQVILVCILTITINIKDMPATKITGLNVIATRFSIVNILPSHDDPHFPTLNTCERIRNGDHIIKIQRSHILMILAIKSNKSATVNKSKKKSLSANPRVSGTAPLVFSVVR